MARINFIELPARDLGAARGFYAAVFGWALTDYGPSYSCTTTGDVDLGLQGNVEEAPAAPLPVVLVDDIEAALAAVEGAGGTISKPVFAFPGGRRFQFLDPNGVEMAVMAERGERLARSANHDSRECPAGGSWRPPAIRPTRGLCPQPCSWRRWRGRHGLGGLAAGRGGLGFVANWCTLAVVLLN